MCGRSARRNPHIAMAPYNRRDECLHSNLTELSARDECLARVALANTPEDRLKLACQP